MFLFIHVFIYWFIHLFFIYLKNMRAYFPVYPIFIVAGCIAVHFLRLTNKKGQNGNRVTWAEIAIRRL